MFDREFEKQQGEKRPSRPPSIASSHRSATSPRRRGLTPRSVGNSGFGEGARGGRPPIPSDYLENVDLRAATVILYHNVWCTYTRSKMDQFRKAPENRNMDVQTFEPVSKRLTALTEAKRSHEVFGWQD